MKDTELEECPECSHMTLETTEYLKETRTDPVVVRGRCTCFQRDDVECGCDYAD